MKKKYLKTVCTGLALLMCSMTACSGVQLPSGEIPSENIVTSESASGDIELSSNTETDLEQDEDIPKNTLGGKPWLDTDLKENISADLPVSAKDDFYWYVNKDWLLSTEIDPEVAGNKEKTSNWFRIFITPFLTGMPEMNWVLHRQKKRLKK